MSIEARLEKLERKYSGQVVFLWFGNDPAPPSDFDGPTIRFTCLANSNPGDWNMESGFCYPSGYRGPRYVYP